MLHNEYLDAKIGLDTEENEPSKVCRYQPATPPTVIYAALPTPGIEPASASGIPSTHPFSHDTVSEP